MNSGICAIQAYCPSLARMTPSWKFFLRKRVAITVKAKPLSSSLMWCCLLRCTRWILLLNLWVKNENVTIQMKATEQVFPVLLLVMLYKVFLMLSQNSEMWVTKCKFLYSTSGHPHRYQAVLFFIATGTYVFFHLPILWFCFKGAATYTWVDGVAVATSDDSACMNDTAGCVTTFSWASLLDSGTISTSSCFVAVPTPLLLLSTSTWSASFSCEETTLSAPAATLLVSAGKVCLFSFVCWSWVESTAASSKEIKDGTQQLYHDCVNTYMTSQLSQK